MKRIRTYHHGDLRRALLTASRALLRDKGASGFSLREAARAVGVDAAASYRHFKNREEVLVAIAQEGFEALATRVGEHVARHPAGATLERLLAVGRAYFEFAADHPAEFRVMFGDSGRSARDPSLAPRAQASAYEVLERAAAAHFASDDEARTRVLWAAVHGVTRLVIDGALPAGQDGLLLLDQTMRATVRGLEAPPRHAGRRSGPVARRRPRSTGA